jgi:hypothetical protein
MKNGISISNTNLVLIYVIPTIILSIQTNSRVLHQQRVVICRDYIVFSDGLIETQFIPGSVRIDQRNRVVDNCASYLGSPGFKPRPEDRRFL